MGGGKGPGAIEIGVGPCMPSETPGNLPGTDTVSRDPVSVADPRELYY